MRGRAASSPKEDFGIRAETAVGDVAARVFDQDGARTGLGTFATKTEADRALTLAAADIARGAYIDLRRGGITLTDYAWSWLEQRTNLRPRSRELYEGYLRLHILPTLGDLELSSISPALVRKWHAKLTSSGTTGAPTIATSYRLLRTIFGTAVDDELLPRNPCLIKGAGVEYTPERPVATIEQVQVLVDAADERMKALILMATYTSMRMES